MRPFAPPGKGFPSLVIEVSSHKPASLRATARDSSLGGGSGGHLTWLDSRKWEDAEGEDTSMLKGKTVTEADSYTGAQRGSGMGGSGRGKPRVRALLSGQCHLQGERKPSRVVARPTSLPVASHRLRVGLRVCGVPARGGANLDTTPRLNPRGTWVGKTEGRRPGSAAMRNRAVSPPIA